MFNQISMNIKVKVNGISVLLLRILQSGIFINAGITHLVNLNEVNQIENSINS